MADAGSPRVIPTRQGTLAPLYGTGISAGPGTVGVAVITVIPTAEPRFDLVHEGASGAGLLLVLLLVFVFAVVLVVAMTTAIAGRRPLAGLAG